MHILLLLACGGCARDKAPAPDLAVAPVADIAAPTPDIAAPTPDLAAPTPDLVRFGDLTCPAGWCSSDNWCWHQSVCLGNAVQVCVEHAFNGPSAECDKICGPGHCCEGAICLDGQRINCVAGQVCAEREIPQGGGRRAAACLPEKADMYGWLAPQGVPCHP